MKVEKSIKLSLKYKSISLTVSDVDSYDEANEILRQEVLKIGVELFTLEDIDFLNKTIGLVVIKNE